MNKPAAITVTLVHTRDTKNCRVFEEMPASADAKPQLRSPLYLPLDTPGVKEAVAVEVSLTFTGTAPATTEAATAEQPSSAPATPAKGKREKAAAAQ